MKGQEIREQELILEVKNLDKSFGKIQALLKVNLKVYAGQVLAIVGDNGAGKTTFIKLLSGVLEPDQGEIIVNSETFKKMSPSISLKKGISTVYQDLALIDCRDVACNLFLGREPVIGKFFVNKRKMLKHSRALLESLKIKIPQLDVDVGKLSGGQRQGIAVARAILQGGKLIIFDEPTAAMGVKESTKVLSLIRNLAERGFGIIVISHNLHQVFEISHRICVMRQGHLVEDFITKDTNPDEVVGCITGVNKYYEVNTDEHNSTEDFQEASC
ncbi:MAG: sugar ABC transporter ATP-binding protein [Candidatus Syntrophonatronum acetioxidans]|uniref:Sugar ABC transporter ATP-binding protein n=1 Tax=Candidatus Syntrophonatronum acetioxidans TaxID=1795816 RepID=A0A424YHG8_9FIRM|nr:MAG: sugar ABC transporter ATP-binding protein [Candidatus Syntrophonatronum acetioxidans]